MQISIERNRLPIVTGQTIEVTITSSSEEAFSAVKISLDNFSLCDDQMDCPCVFYQNYFSGVGDVRPGKQHTLEVEVKTGSARRYAVKKWVD